ncbi:fungal-specific transcription factor domain-containing protein [Xylariomycetidae sp. FL0641]|nr:fungal-specific transcription factor domain-containing protein [Xylariomycetidae sp. FL0641]
MRDDDSQPVPAAADGKPARDRPPPNRRRDKPQLSCHACRRRKLRCDRHRPCSNCAKQRRGATSSCTYASSPETIASGSLTRSTKPAVHVHDRLRDLENLVVSLMNKNPPAQVAQVAQPGVPAADEEIYPPQPEAGSLKLSGTETRYQDQTHWDSVLDAISDLKEGVGDSNHTEQTRTSPETPPASSPPVALLYGCKHVSKEELLAAVPARHFADSLLAGYFQALDMASCVIHKGEFMKQYEAFWADRGKVSTIWLGMLFCMFSIAAQYQDYHLEYIRDMPHVTQPDMNLKELSDAYLEKAVQCLVVGEYTKCGPFVLETLSNYIAAEYCRRRDSSVEVWLVLGTTVNLAMRMGYHRDPRHFKEISPYEGEIRRRIWAMLYHMELGLSGAMGMPRQIRDGFVDTEEPRNLLESDFDADTTELPPSRPDTEPTPMMLILAKVRMAKIYGLVSDVVTATQPTPYSEILRIDQVLKDALDNLPAYCRVRSVADSAMDPPAIIAQRIWIQLTYHKAHITLHRRYLTLARDKNRYSHSRRAIVDSSLEILKFQTILHDEVQPCGRLFSIKWRSMSIASHDFLLATSILCFYLKHSGDSIESHELQRITKAMESSYGIWTRFSTKSADAKKAVAVIDAVLPKFLGRDVVAESRQPAYPTPTSSHSISSSRDTMSSYQVPFSFLLETIIEPSPTASTGLDANTESWNDFPWGEFPPVTFNSGF